MSFVRRPLSKEPPRLGDKLRTLRRSKMLTLEMLAKRTQLHLKYLRALEDGDFGILPAPLYTRNFVRAYVRSLEGNEQYFLELFETEVAQSDLLGPHRLPRERTARWAFYRLDQWGRRMFLGGLGLMAVSFFAWQGYRVLAPPYFELEAPIQDEVVGVAQYAVKGRVMDLEATLYINGALVSFDQEGFFSQQVALAEGPNTLTVAAARRFSLEREQTFVLVYQPVGEFRQ